MEISDRRYLELVASVANRLRRNDPATTPRQARRMPSQGVAMPIEHRRAATPQSRATREVKEILLVDPNPDGLRAVQAALCLVADVEVCSEFLAARARLLDQPPDLLVTNVRLWAYNGLHLIHLAARTHTRCIAYSPYDDAGLAREVQAAGAFYERLNQLPLTLPTYVNAVLPGYDRRDPTVLDRRFTHRGGRRCTDRQVIDFQPERAV